MGLLQEATNQTAYLKYGAYGPEGSGKTHTSVLIAIGMLKLIKGDRVAFFDTEKGSDFHIERFKTSGIKLLVKKSKSFKDLIDVIKECEANGIQFLIIDSITHVWRDLCESWMRKKNKTRLTMNDWTQLKTEWGQFTDLYLNSKVHIAMLGRAGNEYDISEDDEGNQEMSKSGTKMKVESETGHEPDLLLEFFKAPVLTKSRTKKGTTKTTKERGIINSCFVLKDRTNTIMGKTIQNPDFKNFESVIKFLNIGGEHLAATSNDNTLNAFQNNASDFSYNEKKKQHEIAVEKLSETLVLIGLDGRSAETSKKRTELLIKHLGTSGSTAIQSMDTLVLNNGINAIRKEFDIFKGEVTPDSIAEEMKNDSF